jgi:hypothetical protein
VGGENCGPWVRLYTGGHEGRAWPWCAAFTSFLVRQACETLGVPLPITPSLSCDVLAASAKQADRFIPEAEAKARVAPGDIFLVRKTPTDWTHTGIVLRPEPGAFLTIEGNTSSAGEREGYEACSRVRTWAGKDFIDV